MPRSRACGATSSRRSRRPARSRAAPRGAGLLDAHRVELGVAVAVDAARTAGRGAPAPTRRGARAAPSSEPGSGVETVLAEAFGRCVGAEAVAGPSRGSCDRRPRAVGSGGGRGRVGVPPDAGRVSRRRTRCASPTCRRRTAPARRDRAARSKTSSTTTRPTARRIAAAVCGSAPARDRSHAGTPRRDLRDDVTLATWCSRDRPAWAERRTDICAKRAEVVVRRPRCGCSSIRAHRTPDAAAKRVRRGCRGSRGGRQVVHGCAHGAPPRRRPRAPWPLRVTDFDVFGHVNNAAYWARSKNRARAGSAGRRVAAPRSSSAAGIDPGDEPRPRGDPGRRPTRSAWLMVGDEVRASARRALTGAAPVVASLGSAS